MNEMDARQFALTLAQEAEGRPASPEDVIRRAELYLAFLLGLARQDHQVGLAQPWRDGTTRLND